MILRGSKHIHITIENTVNSKLSDMGLTAAQSHVLMYIMDHGGENVCSAQIHKYLNVTRATVSGLIKKLRAKGYLTYESIEGDERIKNVVVTAKALEVKAELDNCLSSIEEKAFADFTEEELEVMNRLQERMIKNILSDKPE